MVKEGEQLWQGGIVEKLNKDEERERERERERETAASEHVSIRSDGVEWVIHPSPLHSIPHSCDRACDDCDDDECCCCCSLPPPSVSSRT
jgi:hypothetical protein